MQAVRCNLVRQCCLGGLGYLNMTTGRNISLVDGGIVTRGNILNPFLPETGANISVLLEPAAMTMDLLPSMRSIAQFGYWNLGKFVASVTGQDNLTIDEAWSNFKLWTHHLNINLFNPCFLMS